MSTETQTKFEVSKLELDQIAELRGIQKFDRTQWKVLDRMDNIFLLGPTKKDSPGDAGELRGCIVDLQENVVIYGGFAYYPNAPVNYNSGDNNKTFMKVTDDQDNEYVIPNDAVFKPFIKGTNLVAFVARGKFWLASGSKLDVSNSRWTNDSSLPTFKDSYNTLSGPNEKDISGEENPISSPFVHHFVLVHNTTSIFHTHTISDDGILVLADTYVIKSSTKTSLLQSPYKPDTKSIFDVMAMKNTRGIIARIPYLTCGEAISILKNGFPIPGVNSNLLMPFVKEESIVAVYNDKKTPNKTITIHVKSDGYMKRDVIMNDTFNTYSTFVSTVTMFWLLFRSYSSMKRNKKDTQQIMKVITDKLHNYPLITVPPDNIIERFIKDKTLGPMNYIKTKDVPDYIFKMQEKDVAEWIWYLMLLSTNYFHQHIIATFTNDYKNQLTNLKDLISKLVDDYSMYEELRYIPLSYRNIKMLKGYARLENIVKEVYRSIKDKKEGRSDAKNSSIENFLNKEEIEHKYHLLRLPERLNKILIKEGLLKEDEKINKDYTYDEKDFPSMTETSERTKQSETKAIETKLIETNRNETFRKQKDNKTKIYVPKGKKQNQDGSTLRPIYYAGGNLSKQRFEPSNNSSNNNN